MDVMKSSDLEEWELVADDDERIINIDTNTSTTSLSHVINYFHYSYCPPPLEFVHKTGPSNQLLLLPPPPPPPPVSIDHLKTMVQPPPPPGGGGGGARESTISTLEEDHVSSPKFTSDDFNQYGHPCKQVVVVVDSEMDKGITAVKEEDGGGAGGGLFKIWKWSINYNKNSVRIGGAICSFAAICIMSLSCTRNINNDQTKLHHHFQIYTTTTNDRRQQVVVHRANEALISTGGRIPFIATAARITFGGYYDASASI
ncbi:hypothetical protein MIMGU_mgv1a019333mg [Erythranthe guttata]|uniref:DUF6821 domain-containing protein n=1 Tax=Erythranthe guttata TaxID=4155 RepID=A0A022PXX5_ERYGU|nr:hypothetical protein MIMGU_mgv1a019333mg [Erythranthe guttata]